MNLQTQRSSKKLDNKFEGPFEILETIGSHAYRLKLPDNQSCYNVFYINLLRPAASDPILDQIPPEPFLTRDARGREVWELVEIGISRINRGSLEFRCKWRDTDTVTQELFKFVASADEVLDRYFDLYPGAIGYSTWNNYKEEPWDFSNLGSDQENPLFIPQEEEND